MSPAPPELAKSLPDDGRGVARVCIAGFGVPGDGAEAQKLGKDDCGQLTGKVDQCRVARQARGTPTPLSRPPI